MHTFIPHIHDMAEKGAQRELLALLFKVDRFKFKKCRKKVQSAGQK